MRVLVLHDRYDDAVPNGENAIVRWETAALKAQGIAVSVIETPSTTLAQPLWIRGLRHLGGIYSPQHRAQVAREIERFKPDLAHVHNLWPHLTASVYYACRDAGVPIVQTLHNYRLMCIADFLCRDGRPCQLCLGNRFAWHGVVHRCVDRSFGMSVVKMAATGVHNTLGTWNRMVDAFIVTSESMRARFIAAGIAEDKLQVKPSCAPDLGYRDAAREYFCFAGRLRHEKGIDLLLAAWTGIRDIELRIAGAGPLEDDVRRAAAANPCIRYVGMLSHEGVAQLMGGAVATLVPSTWEEPSPVVIVQSFSVGTPVIASHAGTPSHTVTDGVTGRLFAIGDAAELVRQVRWASAQREACRTMGLAARREYELRYSVERNSARLLEIYARTLRRPALTA